MNNIQQHEYVLAIIDRHPCISYILGTTKLRILLLTLIHQHINKYQKNTWEFYHRLSNTELIRNIQKTYIKKMQRWIISSAWWMWAKKKWKSENITLPAVIIILFASSVVMNDILNYLKYQCYKYHHLHDTSARCRWLSKKTLTKKSKK